MAKKRTFLLALPLLAALVGAALWLFVSQSGSISAADAQRVRMGMTLAEVEALFGKSGNHWDSRPHVWLVHARPNHFLMWSFTSHGVIYEAELDDEQLPPHPVPWSEPLSPVQFWAGRDGVLQVNFDQAGKALSARYIPGRVSPLYQPDTLSWLRRAWAERFAKEPAWDTP